MTNQPRWSVVITYRHVLGPVPVPYDVEELSELQGIVERGPDWNCIENITVTLSRVTIPGLTIENALGDEE